MEKLLRELLLLESNPVEAILELSSQGTQTTEFMVELRGQPVESLTRFELDLWNER